MKLPPEQEAIRTKCFNPTGNFIEFPTKDVERSVSERFEKIVDSYPNHLAMKTFQRSVTYSELNGFSNRIAHSIIEQQGTKKEPIGLLFEDIIDGLAASLAALKLGKPYVALDPAWPLDRLSSVLADSKASLILTNNQQLETARRFSHTRLHLFNTSDISDFSSSDNLHVSPSPDEITAITYTSGSTGEPKGVFETNRSRLHNTMVAANQFQISPNDKLSLIHSIYFGAGQDQACRALLNGTTLISFDIKSMGLDRMAEWINTEKITILYLPVAVFRQFVDSQTSLKMLGTVRIVQISGAPISQTDFELYKAKFPRETLFAFQMGSTETHIMCSGIVDQTFTFPKEGTLAGYPIADKEIRVIDDNGHDVALGEVGEVAGKSRYLASGYWERPELTKSKFLPDPADSDARIYLTGDLGKILPDGFVVHMGRKDFMVKIRGYRVEPGEIERLLLTHPEIESAAVVPWDRKDGEKYLATYFVAKDNSEPTADALRVFLKARLPDYMVPSVFMSINSLPLTNGKLDRKSLPKPDDTRPELSMPYAAPKNETENHLVKIWEEILEVHPIGIHDNFFDLGGHSLAATRVVSRVIKQFQLEIPLQSLFQSPTVADMAAVVTEHQGKALDEQGLAAMLDELESMSDEDAEQRLGKQHRDISKA